MDIHRILDSTDLVDVAIHALLVFLELKIHIEVVSKEVKS